MDHKTYNTTVHIVEIERETIFRLSETPRDIWCWEIIIGTNGDECKGKAYEASRDVKILWEELRSDPLGEMIEKCKQKMK